MPIQILLESPFLLQYGDSVFYKVRATNAIGSSAYSDNGNAGILKTVPSAPLSLASNAAAATQT